MYHYTSYASDTLVGGTLWRDTAAIREELCQMRAELKKAEGHMKETEARKEELVLLLSAHEAPETLAELEEIVGDCEEIRDSERALLERVEALSEELSETLWWLRGSCA